MQSLLGNENSRSFDAQLIANFSRKDAYECKIPRSRSPNHYEVRISNQEVPNPIDPLTQRWIPPNDLLRHWQDLIQRRKNVANGHCYIETTTGNYSEGSIQTALRLQTANSIKKQVEKEVDWLSGSYLKPNSVDQHPSMESIQRYKSLIWVDGSYGREIPRLRMEVTTLSWLCGNEYLSSDHMHWLQWKLNSIQQETVVFYLNVAGSYERIVRRILSGRHSSPKALAFMMNVGMNHNADVYLGCDARRGNHFTLCYLDKEANTVMYCDSLGWKYPSDLMAKVKTFYAAVYERELYGYTVVSCHDYTLARGSSHFCDKSKCATFYPLQTCSTVCGVVAMILTAIACLAKPFFDYITKVHQLNARHVPNLYIAKPTQYARYLRRVLMAWLADDVITIAFVVPVTFLELENRENSADVLEENLQSDSDSEPDVVRAKPFEKTAEQMPFRQSKTNSTNRNVAENGLFKCRHCDFETRRKFNLTRHVSRHHENAKNDTAKELQQGDSLCFECGSKFHKIFQLREHLSTTHNMSFRIENLYFEHYEGTYIYLRSR